MPEAFFNCLLIISKQQVARHSCRYWGFVALCLSFLLSLSLTIKYEGIFPRSNLLVWRYWDRVKCHGYHGDFLATVDSCGRLLFIFLFTVRNLLRTPKSIFCDARNFRETEHQLSSLSIFGIAWVTIVSHDRLVISIGNH